MSTPALRTEQIYVTRSVRNGLDFLAQTHLAKQPEGAEGPSIGAVADGIADSILRDYLEAQPRLAERRRKISKFFAQLDAEDAQQQP